MSPGDGGAQPANITQFPSGEIGIVWADGAESYFDPHALRCACACAQCVDEMTGHKTLDDRRVPAGVRAVAIHRVGNYAISIVWSDGHDTGIYPFSRLRELG
jgi:DUF971 family protein